MHSFYNFVSIYIYLFNRLYNFYIYADEIVIASTPLRLYAPPSLALIDIDDRSYQSSITLLTK